MGTDIHMLLEVRDGTRWKPALPPRARGYSETGTEYPRVADRRNYGLFAMLADVRNGRGFAGIRTGEGYAPISPPKGLPDDLCDEYQKGKDAYDDPNIPLADLGDHSQSWLGLDELLAYDWHQATINRGVVDILTFAKWDERNSYPWDGENNVPDGFCGSVSGGGVRHVTNDEARAMVKALGESMNDVRWGHVPPPDSWDSVYTEVEWKEAYWNRAGDFISQTMTLMLQIAHRNGVGYGDVRCVFGFDS